MAVTPAALASLYASHVCRSSRPLAPAEASPRDIILRLHVFPRLQSFGDEHRAQVARIGLTTVRTSGFVLSSRPVWSRLVLSPRPADDGSKPPTPARRRPSAATHGWACLCHRRSRAGALDRPKAPGATRCPESGSHRAMARNGPWTPPLKNSPYAFQCDGHVHDIVFTMDAQCWPECSHFAQRPRCGPDLEPASRFAHRLLELERPSTDRRRARSLSVDTLAPSRRVIAGRSARCSCGS